jgi:hypothetical protein
MIGASLETEQGLGLLVEKDAIYYPMLVNRLAACVLNPALDLRCVVWARQLPRSNLLDVILEFKKNRGVPSLTLEGCPISANLSSTQRQSVAGEKRKHGNT